MQPYLMRPRDILFFRDARPMGGASAGQGADWPLPSVLHSALISALHEAWPEGSEWESEHRHLNEREKEKFAKGRTSHMRFGGLHAIGPFPSRNGIVFLPTPADLLPGGGLMRPVRIFGTANLPSPLLHPVAGDAPPSKEDVGAWMPLESFRRYLAGDLANSETVEAGELHVAESRPGVGIDPDTHANRDGVFYQAEYLRLAEDVGMVFWAEAEARKHGQGEGVDLLDALLPPRQRIGTVLGGQRGVAWLERADIRTDIERFASAPAGSIRIKWVLLTPALFDGGWRPDWIHDDGRVLLRRLPDRANFATRKAWREAAKDMPGIDARLVAARIPKPLAVSGWKLHMDADHAGGGAKPTRLLVPAGSVYHFECADAESATALVAQLHLKVKSQRLGEKGFGLGACGTWEYLEL